MGLGERREVEGPRPLQVELKPWVRYLVSEGEGRQCTPRTLHMDVGDASGGKEKNVNNSETSP